MIDVNSVKRAFHEINDLITKKKDYLTELDSQNGDGDLGLSMSTGFKSVCRYVDESAEIDLGKLFMQCASVFNEAAPSSLGTILSFGMMGMAKTLKDSTQVSISELANAMEAGIEMIMQKAGSKQGEKTVLDAIIPGVLALKEFADEGAYEKAALAATEGAQSTKDMEAVHGRAIHHEKKSIGLLDGGAILGALLFEGIQIASVSK